MSEPSADPRKFRHIIKRCKECSEHFCLFCSDVDIDDYCSRECMIKASRSPANVPDPREALEISEHKDFLRVALSKRGKS